MNDRMIADLLVILVIIYATSLHEMAHAYVSTWLGDPTPGRHGRLTWNPIPHLSPVMTAIIMPLVLYVSSGGSRLFILALTPVDPTKYKRPLRDNALVSGAGPATNFLITALLVGVMHIPGVYAYSYNANNDEYGPGNWTTMVLPSATYWIYIMGFFNLLPLPPLDGYGIFRGLMPLQLRRTADDFARSQFAFLFVFVVAGFLFQYVHRPIDDLYWRVLMPHAQLME